MKIDPAQILGALYEQDSAKYFDEPADVALFDPPAVAVAAADDPWFVRFKQTIGDFHWTPAEALTLAAPGATARSVISWSMPVAEAARIANRTQTDVPARPWAYVRTYGVEVFKRMATGLIERLDEMGFAAAAPGFLPGNKVQRRDGVGLASCWSERHVAFVAGLGTFGISGGLITSRGVAQRLCSVVTDAQITPTPRPYGDDPFAWCLGTARDECGACVKRCPAGSIGQRHADRDKDACRQHSYGTVKQRGLDLYGWDGAYGCGLCQTATPCEHRNPTQETKSP